MNLYVRLLKVLLLFFLRPRRLGMLEESLLHFRVWPNDLDINGHMNNGRYLTLMDLGRLDVVLRIGAARACRRRKWYPVLAGAQVRFRRSLRPFQAFAMRTRIIGWDGKWVYLEQILERRGTTVCHAFLKGVFMGAEGSILIADMLGEMGVPDAAPPMSPALQAWVRSEGEMAVNKEKPPAL